MVKTLITFIKTVRTNKIVKTVKILKTVKTIRTPSKYQKNLDRDLICPYMSQINRRLLRELCEDTQDTIKQDTIKQDTIEQDTVEDNYFWDNSHVWNKNYKT